MASKVVEDILESELGDILGMNKILFAEEFARTGKKSSAARVGGIHQNTATAWLKEPAVWEAVKRAKVVIANSSVDSDFLIGRINLVAKSSIADYFNSEGEFVGFDNLTEEQKLCMKGYSQKRDSNGFKEVKIELFDAVQATQLLGKANRLFEYEPDDFEGMNEEELNREIEEMEEQLNPKVEDEFFNVDIDEQ